MRKIVMSHDKENSSSVRPITTENVKLMKGVGCLFLFLVFVFELDVLFCLGKKRKETESVPKKKQDNGE
jgi:hypothetical protein